MADLLMIPNTGGGKPLTMTSREIATLVELRHDNVKRTIETLSARGTITLPQTEEVPNDGPGPKTITVFKIGKRDTYVIVAQLSPEFTARLVDRWQELEAAQAGAVALPKTLPEALRLAADMAERAAALEVENEAQAKQLAAAAPKVAFAEAVTASDDCQDLAAVAQVFRTGRTRLIKLLRDQGVFKRDAALPYQRYVEARYFRIVEEHFNDASGKPRIYAKTLVTGRGLDFVRRCIDNAGSQPPLLS